MLTMLISMPRHLPTMHDYAIADMMPICYAETLFAAAATPLILRHFRFRCDYFFFFFFPLIIFRRCCRLHYYCFFVWFTFFFFFSLLRDDY